MRAREARGDVGAKTRTSQRAARTNQVLERDKDAVEPADSHHDAAPLLKGSTVHCAIMVLTAGGLGLLLVISLPLPLPPPALPP